MKHTNASNRSWPTFPQLYRDGELIGGLDIVKEELDADPDFFADYSIAAKRKGETGATPAETQ